MIGKNNSSAYRFLRRAMDVPEVFTKSPGRFWDDPHISAQMLELHINPDVEAASRCRETILAEAGFIIGQTGMREGSRVLDLGCGPGLYVQEFAATGARVTGIDLSPRSLAYARENTPVSMANVDYVNMNYLELDYYQVFDVITLIYYDFCVLNPGEQSRLLGRIHRALSPGGCFIFDVVNENRPVIPGLRIIAEDNGGFWASGPYIEILNTVLYEKPRTEGLHYTIAEENGRIREIRLYHRLFGRAEISRLLQEHGFDLIWMGCSLKGEEPSDESQAYGIIARRNS